MRTQKQALSKLDRISEAFEAAQQAHELLPKDDTVAALCKEMRTKLRAQAAAAKVVPTPHTVTPTPSTRNPKPQRPVSLECGCSPRRGVVLSSAHLDDLYHPPALPLLPSRTHAALSPPHGLLLPP